MTASDLKKSFWNRMDDSIAGMLGAGAARAVPMSHSADADAGCLWFVTAEGADLQKAAITGDSAQYQVADMKSHLFARIDGRLEQVEDAAKLDEIWSAFAAAWFDDGREDDQVRLLRFTPVEAEIWATEGSMSFLYEIARANVTGDKPDGGMHGTVRF